MGKAFTVGKVDVEILDGEHSFHGVPTSEWRGNKQEVEGRAILANVKAADGLRAQIALVAWPGGTECSLRMGDLLAGPADYDRLRDAGELTVKLVEDSLISRIRALRYKEQGRAGLDAVEWEGLDRWADRDSRQLLADLGATRTGTYVELLPAATRFRTEPAVETHASNPAALFAIYALTRIMPLMTGHGRDGVEVIA